MDGSILTGTEGLPYVNESTKKSLLLPNRRAFYAQKRCKNVHTPSINTTTTSLNRVAYFSCVTRGVVILSQKT